ncbi:MAG: amidohydrolase [Acidobacteriia bacterium]|nr:amidohydrolase [Terriglobia bacterium]
MKLRGYLGLSALIAICFSSVLWAQAGKATERVLYNGKIFTAEPDRPYVEAVAIHGDKIVAVGTHAEVAKAVGKDAESVDLQGRVLLPGLIDSHQHALDGGITFITADVGDKVETMDELAAFAADAKKTGKGMRGDILYITGLPLEFWTKIDELNARFSSGAYADQPVLLAGSDGHTGWANHALLRRTGVTKEFLTHLSKTERRYYGFDSDLAPNGFVVDASMDKVDAPLPDFSPEQLLQAGRAAIGYNHTLGITAWLEPSDASLPLATYRRDILMVYRSLSERGEMTVHVAAFPLIDPKVSGDQLAQVLALQREFKDVPNLTVPGVKFFEDGVVEYPSHTAALSRPYRDGTNGELLFDPARFAALATAADKLGLIVHVHAIGDQAVKVALDAIEAARKANGNSGLPHTITHIQFASPADVLRFRQLGVVASMQLLWAQGEPDTIEMIKPYIDPEIYQWQYPARSLLQAGATIAGASDWSVSSPNVFEAMYYAETRKGVEGVLLPGERMPREAMLYAYTRNSARAMNQLDRIGSIAPGKQADFVLVDRDVLTVSAEELKETKVVWTMFGGQIVYRAQ